MPNTRTICGASYVAAERCRTPCVQMQIVRQNINLVDGRRLAYAFFGNSLSATAKNIIYHHGWPSSAAEGAIWSEAAAAHGICLIAVDRPGIGGSTYNPKGEHGICYVSDRRAWLKSIACIHAHYTGLEQQQRHTSSRARKVLVLPHPCLHASSSCTLLLSSSTSAFPEAMQCKSTAPCIHTPCFLLLRFCFISQAPLPHTQTTCLSCYTNSTCSKQCMLAPAAVAHTPVHVQPTTPQPQQGWA